jgi:hypothetical protein
VLLYILLSVPLAKFSLCQAQEKMQSWSLH